MWLSATQAGNCYECNVWVTARMFILNSARANWLILQAMRFLGWSLCMSGSLGSSCKELLWFDDDVIRWGLVPNPGLWHVIRWGLLWNGVWGALEVCWLRSAWAFSSLFTFLLTVKRRKTAALTPHWMVWNHSCSETSWNFSDSFDMVIPDKMVLPRECLLKQHWAVDSILLRNQMGLGVKVSGASWEWRCSLMKKQDSISAKPWIGCCPQGSLLMFIFTIIWYAYTCIYF